LAGLPARPARLAQLASLARLAWLAWLGQSELMKPSVWPGRLAPPGRVMGPELRVPLAPRACSVPWQWRRSPSSGCCLYQNPSSSIP